MEMDPQVQQAQPTAPEAYSPPATNPKNKFPLIIGVIMLLFLVGGGSYYLGVQRGQAKTQSMVPTPTVSVPNQSAKNQINTVTVSPSDSETDTWKTYIDPQTKISFMYPPQWDYHIYGESNEIAFKPVGVVISDGDVGPDVVDQSLVTVNINQSEYAEVVKQMENFFSNGEKEEITVDSHTGIHLWKYFPQNGSTKKRYTGIFVLNNNGKAISFMSDEKNGNTYEIESRKMLQTIKIPN